MSQTEVHSPRPGKCPPCKHRGGPTLGGRLHPAPIRRNLELGEWVSRKIQAQRPRFKLLHSDPGPNQEEGLLSPCGLLGLDFVLIEFYPPPFNTAIQEGSGTRMVSKGVISRRCHGSLQIQVNVQTKKGHLGGARFGFWGWPLGIDYSLPESP